MGAFRAALWLPVLVKNGAAGMTTLAENVEGLPARRYRVETYLIADRADVDGHCVDDITHSRADSRAAGGDGSCHPRQVVSSDPVAER